MDGLYGLARLTSLLPRSNLLPRRNHITSASLPISLQYAYESRLGTAARRRKTSASTSSSLKRPKGENANLK
jgi:hypothetical protein